MRAPDYPTWCGRDAIPLLRFQWRVKSVLWMLPWPPRSWCMRLFDKEGSTPLSDINPFIYTSCWASFNLRLVRQNKYRRDYHVEFPVVSAKYYHGGELAWGEYFEPGEKGKAPLAILIRGWGDQSVLPLKWMVDGLIKRGIACFILYLPFHSSRLPENKTIQFCFRRAYGLRRLWLKTICIQRCVDPINKKQLLGQERGIPKASDDCCY